MTRSIGYYSLSTENPLIRDMVETWGGSLEKVPNSDRYWLMARIGSAAYLDYDGGGSPSEEAEEVRNRSFEELTLVEARCLLQALIEDTGKPLGYYSLLLDNELICDMTETWGQSLENMHEIDRIWLLGSLPQVAWEAMEDGNSDEAYEVFQRLWQLRYEEKLCLYQALHAGLVD